MNLLLVVAWTITLLVSLLPDILFRELTGSLPPWLFEAKISAVVLLLAASLLWKRLRPLALFFAVILSVYIVEWVTARLYSNGSLYSNGRFYSTLSYQEWFSNLDPFLQNMLAVQIPRLTAGILMVLVTWVLMRRRERFFFVMGKLDAPAAPIPLVLTRPPSWRLLGPMIAGAMSLGLLVFVFIFGNVPSLQSLQAALPLLLFVPLFAASNAFGEEMLYRAPWLGALEGPVGAAQALLITSVYFGLAHFYGVPYGVVGAIMAFIPGWLMGKAMLETRGFFWAWMIHFCMDVVIFFFLALGSVTVGG